MAIDKSEFDVWMKDPITQDVLKSLTARATTIEQLILKERTFLDRQNYNHFQYFGEISYYKGSLDSLNAVIKIKYEDFKQTQEENKEEKKDAKTSSS